MTNEWREITVGDIAAPERNALVGGPFGSDLVSSDYVADGIPVIRGQNMNGRWVSGDFAYVTPSKAGALAGNLAHPGDLVFTQRGTLGQVSMIPAHAYDRYLVSQSQMKLTVNGAIADPLFVYYVFRSPHQQDYIRQRAIQTGVPHTNLGILRTTPIPLPNLNIQRAIARILGSLDDKVELNRRMSRALEATARATFKSWFVDFDPVRAKAEGRDPGLPACLADLFPNALEDSELGDIPAGWNVATLDDVAVSPRRPVKPKELDPATLYIGLEHMPRKSIALAEWGNVAGLESGKAAFRRGEILFGKLRPYFHKVGVAAIDGVCSTDIVVLTSKSEAWYGFVVGHASSDAFVAYTNAGSTGTKMPRTGWAEMARYPVALPPAAVGAAFTDLVGPMIERILASVHENWTLAAVRDALLPRLVSGEFSITKAEQVMEAVQ